MTTSKARSKEEPSLFQQMVATSESWQRVEIEVGGKTTEIEIRALKGAENAIADAYIQELAPPPQIPKPGGRPGETMADEDDPGYTKRLTAGMVLRSAAMAYFGVKGLSDSPELCDLDQREAIAKIAETWSEALLSNVVIAIVGFSRDGITTKADFLSKGAAQKSPN